MDKKDKENKPKNNTYLALGLSLGLAFGIIFKNLAIGLSLGVAFGLLADEASKK